MDEQIETLREITLAIALAVAERDQAFRLALGTKLRRALYWNAARASVFNGTLAWAQRFEDVVDDEAPQNIGPPNRGADRSPRA